MIGPSNLSTTHVARKLHYWPATLYINLILTKFSSKSIHKVLSPLSLSKDDLLDTLRYKWKKITIECVSIAHQVSTVG